MNRQEYCTVMQEEFWLPLGFIGGIHDPQSFGSFLSGTLKSMFFTSGFSYDIVIKPTVYRRHVENIGKCRTDQPLFAFPESEGYSKELCLMQCTNVYMWEQCQCIWFDSTSLRKAFAKKYNKTMKQVKLCVGMDGGLCKLKLQEVLLNGQVDKFCPQCTLPPCFETVYDYQISALRFPPKNKETYYADMLNLTNVSLVEKNYFYLNIHLESMNVVVIDVTQSFTLRDLFTYIGNGAGLFLGMSFVSFYELFHHAMYWTWSRLLPKKKKIPKKNARIKTPKDIRPRFSRSTRVRPLTLPKNSVQSNLPITNRKSKASPNTVQVVKPKNTIDVTAKKKQELKRFNNLKTRRETTATVLFDY